MSTEDAVTPEDAVTTDEVEDPTAATTSPSRPPLIALIAGLVLALFVAVAIAAGFANVPGTAWLPWAKAPEEIHLSPFLQSWGERRLDTKQAIDDMQSATEDMQNAADEQDLDAFTQTCDDLRAGAQALRATMPTPDPELTRLMTKGADQWEAVATTCAAATSVDDLRLTFQPTIEATITMMDATERIQALNDQG